MANFNIKINSNNSFSVEQVSIVKTECSNVYVYKVVALTAEDIIITLGGNFENANYTLDGVESPLINPATIPFGTTLTFEFSVQNSGIPGTFLEASVSVLNNTTLEAYNLFTDNVIRENDNAKCSSGELSYDDLTDTPSSKIGNEGKYIKVSADGLTHEYVDAVPGDATYVHTQSVAATTWTIAHLLGKYPSIRIKDDAGNNVYGDVTDVDSSNITVTFNTAFSGVAYLN